MTAVEKQRALVKLREFSRTNYWEQLKKYLKNQIVPSLVIGKSPALLLQYQATVTVVTNLISSIESLKNQKEEKKNA